jgi:WD40 repeat protein
MMQVQFSPTGDVLATASKDRSVRLWIPSAKGESIVMKGLKLSLVITDIFFRSPLRFEKKQAALYALIDYYFI